MQGERREGTCVPSFYCIYTKLMANIKAYIEELLELKLKDTDCYIVKTTVSGNNGFIRVYMDCDNGVTTHRCAEVSRFLEERLEADGLVPEKYVLEVSSPGLDMPLVLRRQYKKNINRKLRIKLKDGKIVKGVLKSVIEDGLVLEKEAKKGKKGKKKKTSGNESGLQNIAFDNISETKVMVVF